VREKAGIVGVGGREQRAACSDSGGGGKVEGGVLYPLAIVSPDPSLNLYTNLLPEPERLAGPG